jgi:molybdopterin/thiamine biosynthesis adenylyltransferase
MSQPAFSYGEFTSRNLGFVTAEQQEKLRRAHVFVGGVGGMGGAAVACLMRSGVGRFTIADIDTFEVSNLNRQMFANLDTVGADKAQTTAQGIAKVNPECQVTVLDGTWVQQLDALLPGADVAINGCDDTKASVALMRAGLRHNKTVVDAFASTLPNVYVVRPTDPRPEVVFGYPTVGKGLDAIDKAMAAECLAKEIEWVMTHSSSADHVVLELAGEVVAGKRKRMSFAPMVWATGCFMAYEAIRVILGMPGGPGPGGAFYNPWTLTAEKPKPQPLAGLRRFFVRRFMKSMLEGGSPAKK